MNKHELSIFVTLSMLMTVLILPNQILASIISLNISTDKQIYYTGDIVKITGNVTVNGAPVSDDLVGV